MMLPLPLLLLLLCAGLRTHGQYRFGDNQRYPPYGGGFNSFEYEEETTLAPDPLQGASGNLSCYSCSLDFTKEGYDNLNPCLGRHGEVVHPEYLVKCGVRDLYCKVEWMEINNVMTALARSCIDTCFYGCRPQGFGISILKCAECCDTNGCNAHYPTIDAGGGLTNSGALPVEAALTWTVMVALSCYNIQRP